MEGFVVTLPKHPLEIDEQNITLYIYTYCWMVLFDIGKIFITRSYLCIQM